MQLLDFIEKAYAIHGDTYDYSRFEYKNNYTVGTIICKIHGSFNQQPAHHLSGCGCPKCSNVGKPTTEEFILKAKKIHGDLYDYTNFLYISSNIKSKIVCKKHGIFEQTPRSHGRGNGCAKCTSRVSKPETAWLDSLNVPLRQHSIVTSKRKINVDGYDPETNTVYQFHGDFFHGNPNKFDLNDYNKKTKCSYKDLYEKTIRYEDLIRKAGYNLIVMWEHDFKQGVV